MGGDNDFNVQAMITRFMWTIWASLSAVRERPLNLITHSLTRLLELTSHRILSDMIRDVIRYLGTECDTLLCQISNGISRNLK